MPSVAIIGPGAIGGTLAAWIAQDPEFSVILCARSPLADLRVETPDGVLTAHPAVLTRPEEARPVDWVLVTTKTYDADATKPWLDWLVGTDTRVAIVQNGVEHVRLFAHLVRKEKLVPVMINLPATRTAPGRMRQDGKGIIAVPEGRNGADLVALFAHTGIEARTHVDFVSQIWIKLCGNCTAIVPALTLRATGAAWNADLETIISGLVEECAAVGRAEGATIGQEVIESTIARARATPEGSVAGSIHADRLAGHPMEIDARNGVIVRLGRKHGIATPMNFMLATLLGAAASPWAGAQATEAR